MLYFSYGLGQQSPHPARKPPAFQGAGSKGSIMARKSTPSLAASKSAARKPGPVTHTVPAGTITPAPVAPPVVAAAPAPVQTVALRGGLAIAKVKLTGKVYRVGAAHNQAWWKQVTDGVTAGKGEASVSELVKAGVPAIFVGYVVRRGYLASA